MTKSEIRACLLVIQAYAKLTEAASLWVDKKETDTLKYIASKILIFLSATNR